jgi:molybdenum cofactor guanylyltransferase
VPASLVIGLFVGGRGSRFGGIAKGNLRLPGGERVVERLVRTCHEVLPEAPLVLVGERPEYSALERVSLCDEPPGIGPLGGLRSLLVHAAQCEATHALALACDLPFVTNALIERLVRESPEALALAPRHEGLYHPLSARYAVRALDAVVEAIAAREHSLQKLFARLGDGAGALAIDAAELDALRDWDSPEDLG